MLVCVGVGFCECVCVSGRERGQCETEKGGHGEDGGIETGGRETDRRIIDFYGKY